MASVQYFDKCMLVEEFLTLRILFAWKNTQVFEKLEAKQSIVIHSDGPGVHDTKLMKWGACFNSETFCIFIIMAGLTVKMLFMLFSI